jgi:hypothetical protein
VARVDLKVPVKPGERCAFGINAGGMQFFDSDTSTAIRT